MVRQLQHNEVNFERSNLPLVLVLDNVRDAKNVGALFRLADAMGLELLWLCGATHRPPAAAIRKASRNASEWVPYMEGETVDLVLDRLLQDGYHIVALEITADSRPVFQSEFFDHQPLALVVGSEKDGVSEAALARAHASVHVPMCGRNSSMNVAMACAMVVFEITRQFKVKG